MAVAKLWYKVGWRNCIVSNDDITCSGCFQDKPCTYKLLECSNEHGVSRCNQCAKFPCDKINDMLKRSDEYQKRCKAVCSAEEYELLRKAFFEKEKNLTALSKKDSK